MKKPLKKFIAKLFPSSKPKKVKKDFKCGAHLNYNEIKCNSQCEVCKKELQTKKIG